MMVDAAGAPGPGVIVVAEPAIHDLLASLPAAWRVQERQPSVAAMWAGLASGSLDKRSRILVFSDSQRAGQPDDADEQRQVARAVVAMAQAGAHVFVVHGRPAVRAGFDEAVVAAAAEQGADLGGLLIHGLDGPAGSRVIVDQMRSALAGVVDLPVDEARSPSEPGPGPLRASVELRDLGALRALESEDAQASAAPAVSPVGAATAGRPAMPPIGAVIEDPRDADHDAYPAQASRDLLDQPKRPGQITITVTSSKGGSGKSTASILLAATIAQASAEAGSPLSVCLIDLDTRDGQVASLIGTFMPTALNIRVQPVWDEERIRRNLVSAEGLGIDTLLAPIRPRTADTVGPDFYRTIVRSLQRMFDVIVMDTSVQYLEPLIADVALKESDEILFVTTLASTAVQGMARALREMTAPVDESGLGVPREKIGIIVNQSVANVGMERDQVLAAGLGVPVVGVVPLATRDVLTATNLNRMHALLDHPLLGPAYNDLARACLPGRDLATWRPLESEASVESPSAPSPASGADGGRRRGLFRK